MSRIGKKPIDIPKDIKIEFVDNIISVEGKFGKLSQNISNFLKFEINNNKLYLSTLEESARARESHGLIRALIQNMVIGVTKKFSKTLIAEGVGYKFQIDKQLLILNAGFTHPVEFSIPSDLEVKAESPIKLTITGISKEKVGFLAARIRDIRPPEPYKGKGILYEGEIIRRKVGKTGK